MARVPIFSSHFLSCPFAMAYEGSPLGYKSCKKNWLWYLNIHFYYNGIVKLVRFFTMWKVLKSVIKLLIWAHGFNQHKKIRTMEVHGFSSMMQKSLESVILGRLWVFKRWIDWRLRFKICPSLKSMAWTFSLSMLFLEQK